VLNVLTQDNTGLPAEPDDAARFRDRYGLTWPVLGDPDGTWMAEWGAHDGTSQHSYALVDGDGVITWRVADGRATSVDEVSAAVASSGS